MTEQLSEPAEEPTVEKTMYELFGSDEINAAISMIVHGPSKIGKSTFANTAPKPQLLMDAEMAYRFLPGKKIFWDPLTQAPPRYDGSWELCVVIVRNYAIMEKVSEWLYAGQHDFVSLVIDSISEIQGRFKDNLTSNGQMNQQLWGDVLYEMDKLVRGFRDLTEHPVRPLQAVILTAMTQMKDGKYKPYVQGQLQTKLPYFLDIIGFMYEEEVPASDPSQLPTKRRAMWTQPHDMFEAGERVQGRLANPVRNLNVQAIRMEIFPELTDPNKENDNNG